MYGNHVQPAASGLHADLLVKPRLEFALRVEKDLDRMHAQPRQDRQDLFERLRIKTSG